MSGALQWAGMLHHDDAAAFLISRLQIFETALAEPRWPASERAARTLLEIVRPSQPIADTVGTVLGLMVMQCCGIFAAAIENAARKDGPEADPGS